MECRLAQEQILDSVNEGETARPELEHHLASCPDCARFAKRQAVVDAVLSSVLIPPQPSPQFRANLRKQIRRDQVRVWADSLPDKVHFASCAVATVLGAVFLPFSAPMVLGAGAVATLVTYFVLTEVRIAFEEAEARPAD